MTNRFMQMAIQHAREGIDSNVGGPFGAVVVQKDLVVGIGRNSVVSLCDSTAHAEIVAIRDACKKLATFKLSDCQLYTTCEPCPMCLGAVYWARIPTVYYACTRHDAEAVGFDDNKFYLDMEFYPMALRGIKLEQVMRIEAFQALFHVWKSKEDKVMY